MRRIVALDGLRGIAVVVVMLSHLFAIAHGGFLGVDVFFVLSGFLITSLLLRERRTTGQIDFLGFYRRRVARLAPAYLVMLALAVPMMLGPLAGSTAWPVPLAVAASAAYVANWASVLDVDAMGPIIHTWSLSIEEQFYLLWPAMFVLISRRRRSMARWLAGAAALVILARAVGWELTFGVWPYFASVTHSDGLLIGALLAVGLDTLGTDPAAFGRFDPRLGRLVDVLRRRSGPVAGLGLAVLAGLAVTLAVPDGVTYVLGLTVAVVATAAVVGHLALVPEGRLGRALAWGPLVAVGRISYGLYLYHLPIFTLVQEQQLPAAVALTAEVGGTLAVATASWFAIERPVQAWAHRRGTDAERPARRFAVRTQVAAT